MTQGPHNDEAPECGQLLRRAREEQGLSLDDIVLELRLSKTQIQALEEDAWEQLPGVTYARGYLRAYARLLGLDAESLLEAAMKEEEPETTGPPADSGGDREPDEPSHAAATSRPPWGWVIGVLGICGLAVFLWQSAGGPAFLSGDADGRAMIVEGEPEPGGAERGRGGAIVGSDYERQPDPAPAGTTQEVPVPSDPRHIVIEVDERSWVDIRDAEGERLLYQSVSPGQRIGVQGQPPFRVYLGNARGVQIEYQGNSISPKEAPGRLHARFVLGTPSG